MLLATIDDYCLEPLFYNGLQSDDILSLSFFIYQFLPEESLKRYSQMFLKESQGDFFMRSFTLFTIFKSNELVLWHSPRMYFVLFCKCGVHVYLIIIKNKHYVMYFHQLLILISLMHLLSTLKMLFLIKPQIRKFLKQ